MTIVITEIVLKLVKNVFYIQQNAKYRNVNKVDDKSTFFLLWYKIINNDILFNLYMLNFVW